MLKSTATGGTMTHHSPSRKEAREGRSGSMNTISHPVRVTADFMTKYAKSHKDYTVHFKKPLSMGVMY